jgi:hypothetical protein
MHGMRLEIRRVSLYGVKIMVAEVRWIRNGFRLQETYFSMEGECT